MTRQKSKSNRNRGRRRNTGQRHRKYFPQKIIEENFPNKKKREIPIKVLGA